MPNDISTLAFQILQIVWIDLLLSGDNAVVIALACRNLPPRQRRIGIALGTGAAVGLRVLFTFIVVQLLSLPYLQLIGGLLLLGVAVKLVLGDEDHADIKSKPNLWGAVVTIAIADGVMSLDNVLAVVGVAQKEMSLIIFGIALSIPFVVFGSGVILKMIDRWPLIVWAGAALLGWVAGQMMTEDKFFADWLDHLGDPPDISVSIAAAIFVVLAGLAINRLRASQRPAES